MGKSAPSPTPPRETSAAATGTNVSTAIANAFMTNMDETGPDGSRTFTQSGQEPVTDPYTGQTYQVPRFSVNTTLSPQQQAIADQNNSARLNMATTGANQSAFLNSYLGQGMDASGAPALRSNFGPNFNGSFNGNVGLRNTAGLIDNAGLNTNAGQTTNAGQNGNAGQTTNAGQNGNAGQMTNAGQTTNAGQRTNAGLNQNFSLGTQLGLGENSGMRSGVGPGFTTTYAGDGDFSGDRRRVEDAMWERSAGDRTSAEASLRTGLANKGIREGSAAWNSEMERLGRQNTDARLATTLAGGQEQSRMVNLARDRAMFGNDAVLGRFNSENQVALASADFTNRARAGNAEFSNNAASNVNSQNNAAALANSQFANQANLTNSQFSNQANLTNATFANQANLTTNEVANRANLTNATFANQANLTNNEVSNQANLTNASFANQANATNTAFANDALIAGGQFTNAARGSEADRSNNAAMQQAQFGMAAQNAQNQTAQSEAQFGNAARGQSLSEMFAMRNQPINEISALMAGGQVSQPNFQSGVGVNPMPTTDNASIIGNFDDQRLRSWQETQGARGSMLSGIGGMFAGGAGSAFNGIRNFGR